MATSRVKKKETILNDMESLQIAQEIAICVKVGMTSWDILKLLRSARKAKEEEVATNETK